MQRRLLLLAAAALAGFNMGCSAPPPSEARLSESIVLTKYAPDASFGAYHTFFIRPEIRVLGDDDTTESLDDRYATPLLVETTEQLVARGYQQADSQADAELAVELVYVRSVSSAITCYSWWDSSYWGYPAWGYYPYYGCSSSTWRAGTLATMIVDLTPAQSDAAGGGDAGAGSDDEGAAGAGPGQKLLSSIWFSGVYGVEYDYTESTVERARHGIEQAFAQSPYLATSP
jgi:hypothetical protein